MYGIDNRREREKKSKLKIKRFDIFNLSFFYGSSLSFLVSDYAIQDKKFSIVFFR